MSYLFISYSKKNKDYADKLAAHLIEQGFDVWIDDALEPSDDWWKSILTAIRGCGAFIVIMTPESDESRWVQREIGQADGVKPIFPLLLEGDPDLRNSDNWSIFVRTQYEDVRGGKLPSAKFLSKLAQKITRQNQGKNLNQPIFSQLEQDSVAVRSIIGDPFEWVDIPGGKVTLEDDKGDFAVAPFALAKYPVTVAQYSVFMKEGGYRQEKYWTQAGWKARLKENWTAPRYAEDVNYKDFFHPDHPIIGVSWYEALAFCRWVAEKTGQGILLPTEQQWQRAAQGDDQRTYPWGNTFDPARCNSHFKKSGLGRTTPVTQYPQGASPYGVLDMSGNVWEWTLTEYKTGKNDNLEADVWRTLKGGSWSYDDISVLRVAYRSDVSLDGRYSNWGFRLARS